MSAQPQYTGLTYDEIRAWAAELGAFTASGLARAMGVDHATGRNAVIALCDDGICVNTGDELDGPNGYEPVIEYAPLPPGPTRREPSAPDPVQATIAKAGRIVVGRGTPIRIRTRRDMAKALSTPGARQHHLNNEREYERQKSAKEERAVRDAARTKAVKEKRQAARAVKAKRNKK